MFKLVKGLTKEEIKEVFIIDSSIPSGIRYKNTISKRAIAGLAAGTQNKRTGYYRVFINGEYYYTHHIVCILAGIEGIDKVIACAKEGKRLFVVDHIDNNKANNAPDNLRVLSHGDNVARSKNSNTGIRNIYHTKGGYIVRINNQYRGIRSTLEDAIKLKEIIINNLNSC